jgi:hypothetical protein
MRTTLDSRRAMWILSFFVLSCTPAFCGVNLGIADDETFKRPNSWSELKRPLGETERLLLGDSTGPASRPGMSIAWRNANQIEEVEVRVRNLGDQPGEGRVFVDVLDETGKVLLHLEPPDEMKVIRVPAADRGGREGKVIRMKANWELNTLIDRYDRSRTRYDVRATVETLGPDTDLSDNAKVKSWNIPFRVRSGFVNTLNYSYQNHTNEPVTVKWVFMHTPYPPEWEIQGVPSDPSPFTLQPGQIIRGTLSLKGPEKIEEGAFVEARLTLLNTKDSSVFEQHEWFQVYDTIPPDVSNYKLVVTDDHRIAIQALVADKGSGVLEATGVVTEYSTDGGRTWSARAHNYNRGNFVKPTLFETVLGPFAPGTKIMLRFSASDTAGNIQGIIPKDAIGIEAPQGISAMTQNYIFPRAQSNPVFDLALDKVKTFELHRIEASADKLLEMSTIEVEAR